MKYWKRLTTELFVNALQRKYLVALIWHKQEVKTTNQIKSSELLE